MSHVYTLEFNNCAQKIYKNLNIQNERSYLVVRSDAKVVAFENIPHI